jgi:hypothetical protein
MQKALQLTLLIGDILENFSPYAKSREQPGRIPETSRKYFKK